MRRSTNQHHRPNQHQSSTINTNSLHGEATGQRNTMLNAADSNPDTDNRNRHYSSQMHDDSRHNDQSMFGAIDPHNERGIQSANSGQSLQSYVPPSRYQLSNNAGGRDEGGIQEGGSGTYSQRQQSYASSNQYHQQQSMISDSGALDNNSQRQQSYVPPSRYLPSATSGSRSEMGIQNTDSSRQSTQPISMIPIEGVPTARELLRAHNPHPRGSLAYISHELNQVSSTMESLGIITPVASQNLLPQAAAPTSITRSAFLNDISRDFTLIRMEFRNMEVAMSADRTTAGIVNRIEDIGRSIDQTNKKLGNINVENPNNSHNTVHTLRDISNDIAAITNEVGNLMFHTDITKKSHMRLLSDVINPLTKLKDNLQSGISSLFPFVPERLGANVNESQRRGEEMLQKIKHLEDLIAKARQMVKDRDAPLNDLNKDSYATSNSGQQMTRNIEEYNLKDVGKFDNNIRGDMQRIQYEYSEKLNSLQTNPSNNLPADSSFSKTKAINQEKRQLILDKVNDHMIEIDKNFNDITSNLISSQEAIPTLDTINRRIYNIGDILRSLGVDKDRIEDILQKATYESNRIRVLVQRREALNKVKYEIDNMYNAFEKIQDCSISPADTNTLLLQISQDIDGNIDNVLRRLGVNGNRLNNVVSELKRKLNAAYELNNLLSRVTRDLQNIRADLKKIERTPIEERAKASPTINRIDREIALMEKQLREGGANEKGVAAMLKDTKYQAQKLRGSLKAVHSSSDIRILNNAAQTLNRKYDSNRSRSATINDGSNLLNNRMWSMTNPDIHSVLSDNKNPTAAGDNNSNTWQAKPAGNLQANQQATRDNTSIPIFGGNTRTMLREEINKLPYVAWQTFMRNGQIVQGAVVTPLENTSWFKKRHQPDQPWPSSGQLRLPHSTSSHSSFTPPL